MACQPKSYFLLDGSLVLSSEYRTEMVHGPLSIYEVIRIIDGVPIFSEDHMQRLFDTARIIHQKLWFEKSVLNKEIFLLIEKNGESFGNVKVSVSFTGDTKTFRNHRILSFIEHHYPDELQYKKGVEAILYHAERSRPEAKVVNHSLRSSIFRMLIDRGAYEALLVDRNDFITEGSRSNVFFVSGKTIYTAPDGEVLSGIARKYVLSVCKNRGIAVKYEKVKVADLPDFDSCFITGTSPGVLPVALVGTLVMQVDQPLLRLLMNGYGQLVRDHIKEQQGRGS